MDNVTTPPEILFIDDDPGILRITKKMVAPWYPIIVTSEINEARKILNEHPSIRVVVSDYQPGPDGDGIEFLLQVERDSPHIRRVLVSGAIGSNQVDDLLERQVIHAFIQKPWEEVEFMNTIRRS